MNDEPNVNVVTFSRDRTGEPKMSELGKVLNSVWNRGRQPHDYRSFKNTVRECDLCGYARTENPLHHGVR